MNRYIAIVECKKIDVIGNGMNTVYFGSKGSDRISEVLYGTVAHFEVGKEYVIIVRENK